MLIRSFVLQWMLVLIFTVTVFYLKSKLNYLEAHYRLLHDAMLQEEAVKSEVHREDNVNTKVRNANKHSVDTDVVIIYNRVPKTASTSFVGVVYDLCKQNKFHVLHINVTNNMHTLTLANQIRFATNVSEWNSKKPAFYHGHLAFLDFEKFGIQRNPMYINLLRKPLDRFVSYYYFLRYGDNFRPHLIRKKHGDTKTFDECIEAGQMDCDPDNMWLQIPFLCGHDPACWEVGNEWALEEAKRNLRTQYLLVGVTEELTEFIEVLEMVFPRFFKGAYDYFLHNNKSHLRQTTQKIEPRPETVEKIQKSVVWKMENELYNFALSQFHAVKKRLINTSKQDSNQRFIYEKIRPK